MSVYCSVGRSSTSMALTRESYLRGKKEEEGKKKKKMKSLGCEKGARVGECIRRVRGWYENGEECKN